MKLSLPVALTLATLAVASPIQHINTEAAVPTTIGKRCLLWWLFCKPKPAPPPAPAPNPPKPTTTPCTTTPTTTPCPTTTTSTPCTTTPTTTPCPTTSSTKPPGPSPTGPETKRDDQEENLAQLFNFIDAANEDDVFQFIHFYKNADKSVVEAWWSGKTVDNQFAPSFPASRIHEIANSEAST